MNRLSFLARTSLLIAFFFFIDKILAFVRIGIISRQFSDTVGLLDTFNAANNLPDVLFALISGGALAMAFIPLMSEYLTIKGRAAAWDLFSRVANLAFLVTGVAAVIISIFAEQIVNAELGIAPGFGAEQRQLLAELMRLNLIGTIKLTNTFFSPRSRPLCTTLARFSARSSSCRASAFRDLSMVSFSAQPCICWFKSLRCLNMNSNGLPRLTCVTPDLSKP
jgi:hypothetical protein